jgi:2,3,4,5-tetrahydropyridine-2,6-dicarboxylate N-succinyltransferase
VSRAEGIRRRLEALYELPDGALGREAARVFEDLLAALEGGEVRAAEPGPEGWRVHAWVLKGIQVGARLESSLEREPAGPFRSAVCSGVYLAAGTVVRPPASIDMGAYLDEESVVEAHAHVGSCAQLGRRVRLGAGAVLGGAAGHADHPAVLEDEAVVAPRSEVGAGVIVGRRAVLGPGVVLAAGLPVFDLPRRAVHRRRGSDPLRLPEAAVVLAGGRRLTGSFAEREGLGIAVPLVVGYRGEEQDADEAVAEGMRSLT